MKINKKIIRLKRFAKSICHCERSVAILLALALVLSLGIVALPMAGTAEANSGTWYVDDALGTDEGTHGAAPGSDAFKTIQYAINDSRVTADDTILVAAGVYAEGDIRINKSLTIQGADMSSTTTIDATGENAGFYIDTDDVAIKDLTVKNSIYRNITIYSTTVSNATIDNVMSLYSDASGIEIHHSTVTNLVINNCLFSGNGLHGMRMDSGGAVNGMTITDSHFDGNDAGMTIYGDTDGVAISNSTFNNNVGQTGGNWTGGYGLYIGNSNGATKINTNWLIDNCQFKDNHPNVPSVNTFSCGIALSPYWANSIVSNITISDSEFSGNQEVGFRPYSVSATDISTITVENCDFIGMVQGIRLTGAGATDFQIHYCNIDGNTDSGVYNSTPTIIDATENWWGNASGPSGVGPGTGDAVSDNVNFIPFLASSSPGGKVVNEVSITKSGLTSANSGDDINYKIIYKNIGTDYATNVVITESYPPEVKFVSADPKPDEGNNIWNIDDLDPGEGGTITVTVHIE